MTFARHFPHTLAARPFMTGPAFASAGQGADRQESLGDLPEWNLADLYPAHDAPEVAADMARAAKDAAAFEARYKGKLEDMAKRSGAELAGALKEMEALEDLMGRIASYAGLFYAGDTTDPVRQKFYGDAQDKLTAASTHLIFFTLELNRIPDAVIDAAAADPGLAHYRPWLDDIRKARPYQLEDRIEQLFHENNIQPTSPELMKAT